MNENPMTSLVIPSPDIKSITRFCIGSSNFSTSIISADTCIQYAIELRFKDYLL